MYITGKIITKIIAQNPQTPAELSNLKRSLAAEFRLPSSPSNMELLKTYRALRKKNEIKQNKLLESLFIKRGIRTLSGVAPIAVLTKPYPCPGQCVYCPTEKAMPKSYLSNEPAVMRAVLCGFDPYKQVRTRLNALRLEGHDTDKIELIVMGGTWSYLPKDYQIWFISECFRACNGFVMLRLSKHDKSGIVALREPQGDNLSLHHLIKNLKHQQEQNEKAKHRIIGLTLETRPDFINSEEIKWMRELGATRIEIGIQSIYDSILQLCRRGHKVKEIIEATKLLKDAGFKICYHIMPNLPGSSPKQDIKMFKELFSNPDFQPDMLKIYPCVVTKNSELYEWWKKGEFKPYTDKQLLNALIEIKKIIPPYVRINRLIRDIPEESIIAGNKISNLREVIRREMLNRDIACKCIRCREVGHQLNFPLNKGGKGVGIKTKLFTQKYRASNGMEYFLSIESLDRKILYAFLRLRIPSLIYSHSNSQELALFASLIPELNNAALIRELHTYGHLVPIDKKQKGATQHLGLGKKLIAEAEKIVKKLKIKKLAIIAGIGVREYYRKLGYKIEGTYMVKHI
jgi:elongator complex protein 3